MERFCTYCGKPLPEDGVCDCQTAQEETTSLDTTQENAQVAERRLRERLRPRSAALQRIWAEDLPMFQALPQERIYIGKN